MSCNWVEMPLGDFIELKRGYDLPKSKREPGDYPIVSSAGTSDYHAESKVLAPGVVTGRYGTIGEVFYVEQDFWPLNTTLYVKDFKGNCPEFVYYLLKTIDFHKYSDKAAVPGVNRNHLHMELVRVPDSYECQKQISDFISYFDKKISINQQTNQTLEEMAQAIFKSWFVDFDPVKAKMNGEQPDGMEEATASLFPEKLVESELGLIPEGWEVKPLDKVAHFQNGLALQKFRPESEDDDFLPVLKIAQLRQGYCDGKEKARTDIKEPCRVYDGDMIFSWSGTLMIDLWTGGNAALNQHLFKVTSKEYNLPLYLYWTKHHLAKFQQIAKDKAVTMGHIKRGHLSESLCVIPPKALRGKMDEVLLPLINQGLNLRLQSNQLAALRDTLLPKLLSGEIELGEVEEQAEVN